MAKVFVGTWVDKKTRIDFKMKCAELELNQGRCYRFAYN